MAFGGGTIKLWLNFFEKIELFGIDIDATIKVDIKQCERTQKKFNFINDDAYSKNFFANIPKTLDVIIDDGPHTLDSQMFFVSNYIELLSVSGLLFVEDIQALHWVDNLMRVVPKGFNGCIRLVDLRKLTSVGDALVLLIHNCSGNCSIKIGARDINTLGYRIISILGARKKLYIFRRLLYGKQGQF